MTRLGHILTTGAALLTLAAAADAAAQTPATPATPPDAPAIAAVPPTPVPPVAPGAILVIPELSSIDPQSPVLQLRSIAGVPAALSTLPATLAEVSALPPVLAQTQSLVALVPALAELSSLQDIPSALAQAPVLAELSRLSELPRVADRAALAEMDGQLAALRGNVASLDGTLGTVMILQDRSKEDARRAAEDARREVDETRRHAESEQHRAESRARRDAGCDRAEDGGRLNDCARSALDDSRWDRAAELFGKAAATKFDRADSALYWKAYSQNKLGQRAEALSTLGEFKAGYAKSRWVGDANALEAEIRQNAGQRGAAAGAGDDDIKMIALQAFGNSPEAVPTLETILTGTSSPKVKDRALFMLAQNSSPQARTVLSKIAKGGSNPDLQMRAVRYLGVFRTAESQQVLDEVYRATADEDVKKQILRSYMVSGDKARLLGAARSETNVELRSEAVRQLGVMKAGDELSELYGRETSDVVKQQILRGMGIGQHADKLFAVAQSEKNPELRRTAIRSLGIIRAPGLSGQLTTLYGKETDPDVRRAVLDALFIQGDATALIALARQEKDPAMKKALVNKLAVMGNSKEAKDYMLELLK